LKICPALEKEGGKNHCKFGTLNEGGLVAAVGVHWGNLLPLKPTLNRGIVSGDGKKGAMSRKPIKEGDMAKETKIVKGGFRATLALIISVLALAVSVLAYTSTLREEELNARLRDMQSSLERMKQESSRQVDRLRDETASALERLGEAVKTKEETE